MATEQVDQEAEYHRKFNRVGDHLMSAANKLAIGLFPADVTGIFFATGIEFLRQHENDANVVTWIRHLADALENGQIGIKPSRLN